LTDFTDAQGTQRRDADAAPPGETTRPAANERAQTPPGRHFPRAELQPSEASDSRWWAEADDGHCNKEAALFAASQPAPLSIV